MSELTTEDLRGLARRIRAHSLRMVHAAQASHIGSCLSVADILAVLFGRVLRIDPAAPRWPDRDRLVLSKGHAAAALYAALAERGFFPRSWLDDYGRDGAALYGHVSHLGVPGVEVSTGSLGHGLSLACGMALAARADGNGARAVCVLSDGECDEGSIWEAALFAPAHRLDNLIAIVDYNKLQSFGRVREVLDLEPFAAKWRAFGWHAEEVDGHDPEALSAALPMTARQTGRPTVVIAHTVKGKGVPFMEDQLIWHYRSPTDEQLAEALRNLEAV